LERGQKTQDKRGKFVFKTQKEEKGKNALRNSRQREKMVTLGISLEGRNKKSSTMRRNGLGQKTYHDKTDHKKKDPRKDTEQQQDAVSDAGQMSS